MKKRALLIALERCELNYLEYKTNPVFFKSYRLFESNLSLFAALEDFLLSDENHNNNEIVSFLNHLSDWLLSYKYYYNILEPRLDDEFIFDRVEGMMPYPSEFVEFLKK
jgi:hypothetical protein